MNTENAHYTPGQSVYINDHYAGQFVENLSDFLMSEEDITRLTQRREDGHPEGYGVITSRNNDMTYIRYYGLRKVFHREHGTVQQALTYSKSFGANWINLSTSHVITPHKRTHH